MLLTEVSQIPFKYTLNTPLSEIEYSQTYTVKIESDGLSISRGENTKPQLFPDYNTLVQEHDLPFELSPYNLPSLKELKGTSYSITIDPVSVIANRFRGAFSVSVVGKNSDLLQLSFRGEIKSKSEKILNRLIELFEIDGIKIGPIFDMQFKSWKDLFGRSEQKSKMFNIHIPTIYQNSFVPSSDFKIIPHIYGPDFIENLVATKAYEYEYTDSKTEDLVIEDVEMEDSQPV